MRIYVPQLPPTGLVQLPEDESRHAVQVLRLKLGGTCELFDGKGAFATAKLIDANKRFATASIVEYHSQPTDQHTQIILGVGLPKGDRQRNVIERATELGIDQFVPITCKHGIAVVEANALERMKRFVVESCKQCVRNRLMDFGGVELAKDWLAATSKNDVLVRFICHPYAPNAIVPSEIGNWIEQRTSKHEQIQQVVFAIGPEGGFSDEEVQIALDCGWQPLRLGSNILRVETAVAVAATLGSMILLRI